MPNYVSLGDGFLSPEDKRVKEARGDTVTTAATASDVVVEFNSEEKKNNKRGRPRKK